MKNSEILPCGYAFYDFGNIDKLYIIPISDIHIGDVRCDYDKLKGYLQWIKEHNAYIILNGDLMTSDIKASVGDVYNAEMNPQEQLDLAIEIFKPFANRILAVVEGNHEYRIYKEAGLRTTKIFADEIGISAYNPDGMYIIIKMGKGLNNRPILYRLYATHGWSSGRTTGSKINAVEQLNRQFPITDCYIASHTHTQALSVDVIYYPDERNNKFVEQKRAYVSAGSFLGHGGYSLRKGLAFAKLGSPRIRLDGTRKDLHVSI